MYVFLYVCVCLYVWIYVCMYVPVSFRDVGHLCTRKKTKCNKNTMFNRNGMTVPVFGVRGCVFILVGSDHDVWSKFCH